MRSSTSVTNCSRTTSKKFWSPCGTSCTRREAARGTTARTIMMSHVDVTKAGMPGARAARGDGAAERARPGRAGARGAGGAGEERHAGGEPGEVEEGDGR